MENESVDNIDVDSLLAQAESPSTEIPMGDEPTVDGPAPEPQADKQETLQQVQKYSFNVNGKNIEATPEQLVKWAQQGYDAPNKIGEYNKKFQEYETKYKPFEAIDSFAKQNPEWWQHVVQSYEQRAVQAAKMDPNNPLASEIAQLKNQLAEFGQFKNQILDERTKAQHFNEDQALDKEISSIRDKYSNLDWNTPNESGYNLEKQILAYANQRGIGNFEDAFKSYYHDKLVSMAEERGKEAVAKDIQKKSKLGLLAPQPTPQKAKVSGYKRGQSYNDLEREALDEIKAMGV
jgi:hypothetical protein